MQPTPTTKVPFALPGLSRFRGYGPVVALILLCIAGGLLNPDFATVENMMNVLTRTAFIGIIAVGDAQQDQRDDGAVAPEARQSRQGERNLSGGCRLHGRSILLR